MSTNESVFSQHVAKIPEKDRTAAAIPRGPLSKPIVPPSEPGSPPIEKTLDWLVNHWTKPSVSARDIYRHGPHVTRNNRKSAIALAKTLVEHGWLVPLAAHRRDRRLWQVLREPPKL